MKEIWASLPPIKVTSFFAASTKCLTKFVIEETRAVDKNHYADNEERYIYFVPIISAFLSKSNQICLKFL